MEKVKEQKQSRHSKAKTVSKEKKTRRFRNNFGLFPGHRQRKDYDKLKSPSSENVSSSTENIRNWSGESGVVNEAFVLDDVQVGGNCAQASLTSVVTAANSENGASPTNCVDDECMSEVSAATSDESHRLQNTNLELSDEVARLREEKDQQTIYAINLLNMCRGVVKANELLTEQYRREIHHIRLTYECKLQQLEKEIGRLNSENSSLKEVNTSLMNNCLMKEDENSSRQDEIRELQKKCSDKVDEITKLHQTMTILMQKLGKVKREKNDKYKVSIANAEHVNVVL